MEESMNRLRALAEKGQSVWLDFLSREIIENGRLKRLIDEDGLAGIRRIPRFSRRRSANRIPTMMKSSASSPTATPR
jgi:hypothetical protein